MRARLSRLWTRLANSGQCSVCGQTFDNWNGGICAACQATQRG